MKSRINTNKEEMKRIIYCLSVEMTRRCNMKCDFCARGDAQNVTITKKIIDKTLEEMEGVYINGLRLSGGEPFLAENEIEYLIEEIIRRKIHINHIELFTNGTIRSPQIATSIKKAVGYINSIQSEDIDTLNWLLENTHYHYDGIEGKKVRIVISTRGHKTKKETIDDTINYYEEMFEHSEEIAVLNQSDAVNVKEKGLVISGNAEKNFDKLFGKTIPFGSRIIDNNYYFYDEMLKDGVVSGYFIEKTLTVSANGNVFPGATLSYDQVDKEFLFNILNCNKDFFPRVEAFCWQHPISKKANNIRTMNKVAEFARKRGRTIEGLDDGAVFIMGYFNSRIDRLEEMAKDYHKILPNLGYADIEGIATASVLLEMFYGEEKDDIIKYFARTCTDFEDDTTIELLSLEWCQGFIKFILDKDKSLSE